jgi:hypothetical protein
MSEVVEMKINSQKKHSIRYDSVFESAIIKSIYVSKTAQIFDESIPDDIKITVDVNDA